MRGFRLNAPGPFWFEDVMFLAIDEGRRLGTRTRSALQSLRRLCGNLAAFDPATLMSGTRPLRAFRLREAAGPRRQDVARLEEPEVWTLATEPLVAAGAGSDAVISLHKAASEQLDALTYILDRMRDELRPIMTYARFEDDTVQPLRDAAALDTSIEALLELSRKNAATRPKDRVLTAA